MRNAPLLVRLSWLFLLLAMAACQRDTATAPTVTVASTGQASSPTAPVPMEPSSTPTPTPNPAPDFVPRLRFPFYPTELQTSFYSAYLILDTGTAQGQTCPAWSIAWQATNTPQALISWDAFFRENQLAVPDFFILSGERSLYAVHNPYDPSISVVDENVQMFGSENQVEAWSNIMYPFWQTMDQDTARQIFERYWLGDLARLLQQATWRALNPGKGRYQVQWEDPSVTLPWVQDCTTRQILYGQVQNLRGTGKVVVTPDGVITELELEFEGSFRTVEGKVVSFYATVNGKANVDPQGQMSLSDLDQEKDGAVPLSDIPLPPKTQFFRQNGAPRVGGRWGYWTLLNLTDALNFFVDQWPRQGFTLQGRETPASDQEGEYSPDYRLLFEDKQGRAWAVDLYRNPDQGTSFNIWAPAGARSLPTEASVPARSAQGMAGAYCRLLGGQPTADGRCQWNGSTTCELSMLLSGDCSASVADTAIWHEPAAFYCAAQGGQMERPTDAAARCRFGPSDDAVCEAWGFLLGECVRGGVTETLPLDGNHFSVQVTGRVLPGEIRRYTVPYPDYPEIVLMLGDGFGVGTTPGILVTWLESPQNTLNLQVYDMANQVVAHTTANTGPIIAIRYDEDATEPFLIEVRGGDAPATFTLHVAWAADVGDSTGPVWVPNGQLDANGRAYFYGISRAGRFEATVEGDATALGLHLLPLDGHKHRIVLDPADGRLRGTVQDRGPVHVLIVVQGPPGSAFQLRTFSYLP